MGVTEAVWVTVIGQFVSLAVIAVVYFKKGIENSFRYLKPERQTLSNIYSIGLPTIVMQILTTDYVLCTESDLGCDFRFSGHSLWHVL